MRKRIWNVVYTIVENHNVQEPYVRLLASFDSEEKAQTAREILGREYTECFLTTPAPPVFAREAEEAP